MASEMEVSVLEVNRCDPFETTRVVTETVPRNADSIVLAVECFSMAANNLSYVLAGDTLRSWDAYPSPAAGWGRVPVWGSARVLSGPESVVGEGTVVTGYLPMATHAVVHAVREGDALHITDEHRADTLPIYRRLETFASDPPWNEHELDLNTALLAAHPFATLLARDLRLAGAVVVSSASSRSAACLGMLLSRAGVDVTALTSAHNRSSVESIGVYDRIVTYDEVPRLSASGDVVYVDFAGNSSVTAAVCERLGHALTSTVAVGGTHLRALPTAAPPQHRVEVFNTGDREVEVIAELGRDGLADLYRETRYALVAWASDWLRITRLNGLSSADRAWRDIAADRSDPLSANVIRP